MATKSMPATFGLVSKDTMQTYMLEIDYKTVSRDTYGMGFIPNFPYNPKIVTLRAKNIDNLRATIFSEYLKRTGTCLVRKVSKDGRRGSYFGKAFNYGQGDIFWSVRDSHELSNVDPKTGKLRRM